jgi:hypothetical protein
MLTEGFLSFGEEQGALSLPLLAPYLLAPEEKPLSVAEADEQIRAHRERASQLAPEIAALEGAEGEPDTADWDPFPSVDWDEDEEDTPLEKLEAEYHERVTAVTTALRRSGRLPLTLPDPRGEGLSAAREPELSGPRRLFPALARH